MADEEDKMAVEDVEDEMDDDDDVEDDDDENEEVVEQAGDADMNDQDKVYIPGRSDTKTVAPHDLEFDHSAYVVYHEAQSGYPCLSFDVVPNDDVTPTAELAFPLSLTFVAGTQAEKNKNNHLMLIRMSNLHKVKQKNEDGEEDEEEESDDEDDEVNREPVMQSVAIDVSSSINRVRRTRIGEKTFVASWLESGVVLIHDVTETLGQLMTSQGHTSRDVKHVKQFAGHRTEGFAMDWSSTVPGRFLTGDCDKDIHLWEPVDHSGGWNVDQRSYKGHESSVEDLQWSPSEKNVFASCSSDKSIRIWDVRAQPHKANMLSVKNSHENDVNVINWNRLDPFLVSGGDDGVIKVWDLRQFKEKKTLATFKQHTAPITSVEWHPTDSSIFAAAGADNQITLWDLGVEKDGNDTANEPEVPPQLLFIHLGQNDIKEIHWHPQYPGLVLSTAESGFNVFKTISV